MLYTKNVAIRPFSRDILCCMSNHETPPNQPLSNVELGKLLEKVGGSFRAFCQESTAYSPDELVEKLKKDYPDVSVVSVFSPSSAQELYFLDTRETSADQFLRVSLPGRELLLPNPLTPDRFEALRKGEAFETDDQVTPSEIKVVIPATLKRNGQRWEVDEKGVLSKTENSKPSSAPASTIGTTPQAQPIPSFVTDDFQLDDGKSAQPADPVAQALPHVPPAPAVPNIPPPPAPRVNPSPIEAPAVPPPPPPSATPNVPPSPPPPEGGNRARVERPAGAPVAAAAEEPVVEEEAPSSPLKISIARVFEVPEEFRGDHVSDSFDKDALLRDRGFEAFLATHITNTHDVYANLAWAEHLYGVYKDVDKVQSSLQSLFQDQMAEKNIKLSDSDFEDMKLHNGKEALAQSDFFKSLKKETEIFLVARAHERELKQEIAKLETKYGSKPALEKAETVFEEHKDALKLLKNFSGVGGKVALGLNWIMRKGGELINGGKIKQAKHDLEAYENQLSGLKRAVERAEADGNTREAEKLRAEIATKTKQQNKTATLLGGMTEHARVYEQLEKARALAEDWGWKPKEYGQEIEKLSEKISLSRNIADDLGKKMEELQECRKRIADVREKIQKVGVPTVQIYDAASLALRKRFADLVDESGKPPTIELLASASKMYRGVEGEEWYEASPHALKKDEYVQAVDALFMRAAYQALGEAVQEVAKFRTQRERTLEDGSARDIVAEEATKIVSRLRSVYGPSYRVTDLKKRVDACFEALVARYRSLNPADIRIAKAGQLRVAIEKKLH